MHRLDSELSTVPFELKCGGRHALHQSSIKALELLQLSETDVLVFCGGDDNALSVSWIILPTTNAPHGTPTLFTNLLPDAHASAINAITVIDGVKHHQNMDCSVNIASSGNDQRLKIWSVQVIPQADDQKLAITLIRNSYTGIADISSLDVWTIHDNGTPADHLVVCGVGMDMWKVDTA